MRTVALALTLATSACAAANTSTTPPLPANAYLLAPENAARLFNQCSREAPELSGAASVPGAADIVRLETALAAVLTAHKDTEGSLPRSASWPIRRLTRANMPATPRADGR